jgi:hypothetical protein
MQEKEGEDETEEKDPKIFVIYFLSFFPIYTNECMFEF